MRTILSYHWHQFAGQKQFLDSTAIPTRKWVSPCHNFSLAKLCFFGTNGSGFPWFLEVTQCPIGIQLYSQMMIEVLPPQHEYFSFHETMKPVSVIGSKKGPRDGYTPRCLGNQIQSNLHPWVSIWIDRPGGRMHPIFFKTGRGDPKNVYHSKPRI